MTVLRTVAATCAPYGHHEALTMSQFIQLRINAINLLGEIIQITLKDRHIGHHTAQQYHLVFELSYNVVLIAQCGLHAPCHSRKTNHGDDEG